MKKQKPSAEEQHKIAEGIIGVEISWENDQLGYYTCPLAEGHSSKTGPKHSRVTLDGCPTFFCWHSSCREFTEAATGELRQKLDFRTPEEKEEGKLKAAAKQQLKYDALVLRSKLDWVYEKYFWELPGPVEYSAEESWGIFLNLWRPDNVIWIGECWNTGGENGVGHFKTVDAWLAKPPNLYTNRFTCASVFRPCSLDRTVKQVFTTPYVVVEFDSLSQDKRENKLRSAAILNYLRQKFSLRMVVDSGNKSLHGWFANDEAMTDEAKFFIRQLGADINTMRPSQPIRVPGGRRDNGNQQSVLWIQ